SPYNNQKNMLVLTSPRNDLLEKSLIFLSEDKEFYKLNGDGTVIDEYGNVTCFKYKEEIKTPTYERIIELNNNSKYLLVVLVALAFFIIVAGILYRKKYNIKKIKTKE
ncbi:MAG: cellulose biosynthesis cyclic di-GMP-binding regulatory protein BcsB, partial [Clostridium sp.]